MVEPILVTDHAFARCAGTLLCGRSRLLKGTAKQMKTSLDSLVHRLQALVPARTRAPSCAAPSRHAPSRGAGHPLPTTADTFAAV
jgi:hypothetical protein